MVIDGCLASNGDRIVSLPSPVPVDDAPAVIAARLPWEGPGTGLLPGAACRVRLDEGEEVVSVTEINGQVPEWPVERELSTEELARRQGVTPVASLRELAHPELWDSDEDYEAFLADLYASRRAGGE